MKVTLLPNTAAIIFLVCAAGALAGWLESNIQNSLHSVVRTGPQSIGKDDDATFTASPQIMSYHQKPIMISSKIYIFHFPTLRNPPATMMGVINELLRLRRAKHKISLPDNALKLFG